MGYEKWSSNLTFPAAENEETENIPVGDLFYVNGTDLGVKSVPAASAVAFSDSLFGRTVQLNITCERADGSPFVITPEQGDSCIFFQVNTTNYRYGDDVDVRCTCVLLLEMRRVIKVVLP